MFDPAAGDTAPADVASRAVWFDSFVTNMDRTARNPNLLCWHKALYFIDHGASLYFQHKWQNLEQMARTPFKPIRDHVLLRWASSIGEAAAALRSLLDCSVLARIAELVPDEWLTSGLGPDTPAGRRDGYVEYLTRRLDAAPVFVEQALRARAELF